MGIHQRLNYLFRLGLLLFLGLSFYTNNAKAQQFNTDNFLVMPHGTGTFCMTAGERSSTMISSFGLILRFEFFVQANLFWEDKKTNSPQHFTTTLYAKYSVWVNETNNGGFSAFLGYGNSPGFYNQTEYASPHKNFWTSVVYTLPLFNNSIFWDLMPGALMDLDYKESNKAAWGFTYSTRLNIYNIIPKSAIVAEFYGTEGSAYSKPEYKIGIRWEPNDFIVPAITYGNNISGTGGPGFEIGILIFSPQFLKKDYIKNNHIEY